MTAGYGVSEIRPLISRLPRNGIVLDIGANIGIWARLFAAQITDGQVFCFEPSPNNFKLLTENMAIYDNVLCLDLACSDRTGAAKFSISDSPGLHHIAVDGEGDVIDVATTRLDDWVTRTQGLPRLDFIKIDVEGHEPEVLAGGQGTIMAHRPIVFFEHLPEFRRRSSERRREAFQFFQDLGYTVCRLDKSGFMHRATGEDLPPDWTNDYVAFDPEGTHAPALKDLVRD